VFHRGFHDFPFGHLQLELTMNGTGREEDVNSRLRNPAQGLCRSLDIILPTASQPANGRAVSELLGHRSHRFKVTGRGDGEPRFNDIDSEFHQRLGDLQLFGSRHAATGRLLAIAKCRIEDDHIVGHDEFTLGRWKKNQKLTLDGGKVFFGRSDFLDTSRTKNKNPETARSQGELVHSVRLDVP
jgi:hypothetical protein